VLPTLDFIPRAWSFFGIVFSEIRPWDFSWDISNKRVIERKGVL
jgi:hypothetical protein